jgi:hypothetical protein
MIKQTVTVQFTDGSTGVYHFQHESLRWKDYGILQQIIYLDDRFTAVKEHGVLIWPWHQIAQVEVVEEDTE